MCKYKLKNNMQATSEKVREKYRDTFRKKNISLLEFSAFAKVHYNTARYFRSTEVTNKADEFLAMKAAEEKQQLSKVA